MDALGDERIQFFHFSHCIRSRGFQRDKGQVIKPILMHGKDLSIRVLTGQIVDLDGWYAAQSQFALDRLKVRHCTNGLLNESLDALLQGASLRCFYINKGAFSMSRCSFWRIDN